MNNVELNLNIFNIDDGYIIPNPSFLMKYFENINESYTFNLSNSFQEYIQNSDDSNIFLGNLEDIVKINEISKFGQKIGALKRENVFINGNGTNDDDTFFIDKNGVNFSALDGNDLIISKTNSISNIVINAGKGDDIIYGFEGGEKYVFNRGDGNDIIHDKSKSISEDLFIWGSDISINDRTITNDGSDMIITINNNGGSIRLINGFISNDDEDSGIEDESCYNCTTTSWDFILNGSFQGSK